MIKRSIIYSVDDETFQKYILESKTYGQILKHFNLPNRGRNATTLKERIKNGNFNHDNIIKNISFGGGWNKGLSGVEKRKISLEDAMKTIFIEHGKPESRIKKYIRYYNLIEYKCRECGIEETWNGKPLTLELDHINGDNCNNLLSNLRFLCPNCHSQSDTFRGRKLKKRYYCLCGKEILKESKKCFKCFQSDRLKFVS